MSFVLKLGKALFKFLYSTLLICIRLIPANSHDSNDDKKYNKKVGVYFTPKTHSLKNKYPKHPNKRFRKLEDFISQMKNK